MSSSTPAALTSSSTSSSSSTPPLLSTSSSSSLASPALPVLNNGIPDMLNNSLTISSMLKSSSFDSITQFLRSSQADFSLDGVCIINNDSTNRDNNRNSSANTGGEDQLSLSCLLSLSSSGSLLRSSALFDKQLLASDVLPVASSLPPQPPLSVTSCPPATPQVQFAAVPSTTLILPSAPPAKSPKGKGKATTRVNELTGTLKRRLSIHKEGSVDIKAANKKKRQEKNREAAQLFRQRQKVRVSELAAKTDALIALNNQYRMGIEALCAENKMLSDQVIYWKNVVASGILITHVPESPDTRQDMLTEFKKAAENLPMKVMPQAPTPTSFLPPFPPHLLPMLTPTNTPTPMSTYNPLTQTRPQTTVQTHTLIPLNNIKNE